MIKMRKIVFNRNLYESALALTFAGPFTFERQSLEIFFFCAFYTSYPHNILKIWSKCIIKGILKSRWFYNDKTSSTYL